MISSELTCLPGGVTIVKEMAIDRVEAIRAF
jgi:hypothetical protein